MFVAATQGQIVRVLDADVYLSSIYCVYHESARNTARVRAAADALVSYFEANASAFARGFSAI